MKEILDRFSNKKIVCLYTNKENTEKFSMGIIRKVSSDKVLFESIDTGGEIDGYMVLSIDDIYLIETDNSYIADTVSEEIDMNGFEFSQFSNCGDDLLVDFLSCIRDLNYIVEIKLVNSDCIDVRGNIVDISNGYVEIDVVDDYNEKDGKAFCKLDSISVVWMSLE